MSIATDKLETIRQQVQYHLDHAEQNKLTPAQEAELPGRRWPKYCCADRVPVWGSGDRAYLFGPEDFRDWLAEYDEHCDGRE